MNVDVLSDPFWYAHTFWPQVSFYKQQEEIIESVFHDAETYVVAGNKLGKDFVAGFICVTAFKMQSLMNRQCRIVTTSVADMHLDLLWGEIAWFLTNSRIPLLSNGGQGGPFVLQKHRLVLKEERDKSAKNCQSYLIGMTSEDKEKMSGHHVKDGFTLGVGDEASGLQNYVHEGFQGWAQHKLYFGNPNPCSNFWRQGIEAGDLKRA